MFFAEYQTLYGQMVTDKLVDELVEDVPEYPVLRDMCKELRSNGKRHILLIFDGMILLIREILSKKKCKQIRFVADPKSSLGTIFFS